MAKTEDEKRRQLMMEKTAEQKRRLRARMKDIESLIDSMEKRLEKEKNPSLSRELKRQKEELAGIKRELQNP